MRYKGHIFVSIFVMLFSVGYSCEPKIQETSQSKQRIDSAIFIDSVKKQNIQINTDKTIINDTDYIPPRNGGINKKWYGNKNKTLVKDTGCYFGKGLRKQHRYRWGQRNGGRGFNIND